MSEKRKQMHPEVPPNCDYFTEENPGLWLFEFEPKGGKAKPIEWLHYLDEVNGLPGIKGIIAAVAEVAWRKEALKYKAPWMKYYEQERHPKAHEAALDNADAWRKWGESALS